jgi:HAD superfamily hydrolase (TIGR01509 family)
VRKPTRHIYERVLGMTQADPARTVFIDDRLQNLAPAASLGVRTLHFTTAPMLRGDLGARGLL